MSNKKITDLRHEVARFKYSREAGFGVSAQVAGEELERLATEHGHVSSALILEAGRPEHAPLHPAFEWDDSAAAERFRLQQAATLARAVVKVADPVAEMPEHRVLTLTKVATEPRPVYVRSTEVAASVSMFADALMRLERRVMEAKSSATELSHLAQLSGSEPERMARIALAVTALEAAGQAVAGLH